MGCQITCKTRDALLNNSYWKKGEQLEMLFIRIHLEHLKPLQGLDYGFSFSTVLSTVDYKSFLILSRNLKQKLSEKQSRSLCVDWHVAQWGTQASRHIKGHIMSSIGSSCVTVHLNLLLQWHFLHKNVHCNKIPILTRIGAEALFNSSMHDIHVVFYLCNWVIYDLNF